MAREDRETSAGMDGNPAKQRVWRTCFMFHKGFIYMQHGVEYIFQTMGYMIWQNPAKLGDCK